MRPLLVFLTLCTVLTLGLWTATQYEVRHVPAGIRGAPWTTVYGYALYKPHAMLGWYWQVDTHTRQAMSGSTWILYGACMVGTLAAGLVLKLGVKKKIPAMAMGARPGATWMTQNGRDS
jgi:hypothetical protein